MDASSTRHEATVASEPLALTRTDSDFAVQIATAVWLHRLTDEAACEALGSYAMARGRARGDHGRLWAALEREYRRCRERQDLCS